MTVAVLLDRLEKVRRTNRGQWIACCPAHKDRRPSLSIRECDDGRVLIHCFAGCSTHEVLSATSLEINDLFPARLTDTSLKRESRPFPAAQILRALAFECLFVSVAAENLAKGMTLSAEDLARLGTAAARLPAGVEVING